MNILIKQIMLGEKPKDILIENGVFSKISDNTDIVCDKTIDGHGKAVFPAFYNGHTHAAMTLLRGYGEDLKLFDWLNKVWKQEAKLTEEDIYNGTRLAILEMIKSGTVFFADMYWHHNAVIRAVKEMKIRANVGITFMDSLSEKALRENIDFVKNFNSESNPLIQLGICPHAIYTCGSSMYTDCFELAERYGLKLHTHLAETKSEFDSSLRKNDCSPVAYLDSLGVLSENTIAAHCVHLTDKDAETLAERGVTIIHNPCSNMKLASGIFDYGLTKEKGCTIALGTDGVSSNNNLSMIEEMKFASLLAKVSTQNSLSLPVEEVIKWGTVNVAKAFGLNAGEIKEGMLADCIILDLGNERLTPNRDLKSNMVFSADSSCIDTVICNGEILMENGHVENEEEITEIANRYEIP